MPKYCSTDAILRELGWNPIYSHVICTVIKYWYRISGLASDTLLADALEEHRTLKGLDSENITDTVQLMLQKLDIGQPLTTLQNLSMTQLVKLLKHKSNNTIEREWQASLLTESTKTNKMGGNKLRLYRQFKTNFKYE